MGLLVMTYFYLSSVFLYSLVPFAFLSPFDTLMGRLLDILILAFNGMPNTLTWEVVRDAVGKKHYLYYLFFCYLMKF